MKQSHMLVIAAMAIASAALADTGGTCPKAVTATYRNVEYGYSFEVPAGLNGRWQSPCNADNGGECICIGNHGLSMDLGNGGVLGVFADYAAELDDPTLGDVLYKELERITSKDFAPAVHIKALDPFVLKGHRGFRVYAVSAANDLTGSPDPEIARVDYIFLGASGRCVIYMRSARVDFTSNKLFLTKLLKSWEWASNNRI